VLVLFAMELYWKQESHRRCPVSTAGEGDKQLLRQILREMGLPRAASREKRAIQFGTRLGKLANIRAFGTNRSNEARHAGTMAL